MGNHTIFPMRVNFSQMIWVNVKEVVFKGIDKPATWIQKGKADIKQRWTVSI